MPDEDQETSKLNRGEAGCILFLVKKLIREGVPADKILVISPYKAQGEGYPNWNAIFYGPMTRNLWKTLVKFNY